MLEIGIAAIGKLKSGPEFDLMTDYLSRLQAVTRSIGFSGPVLREVEAAKTSDDKARQQKESSLLLEQVPNGAAIFVLDEGGRELKSTKLAEKLATLRDTSKPAAWFLIGGADGHSEQIHALVKAGKATALSFGIATWPHMLVRVMLAEQLYRAATILSGHPYHRE